MNKVSNSSDDYEMLDDYSELFEKNWSKVVRGKHHPKYRNLNGKISVTIRSEDGDRYVYHREIKTQAMITADGKVIAEVLQDVQPGEYQATLLIQKIYNQSDEALITGENSNIDPQIKTLQVQAMIEPEGKLTAQVPSEIITGNYQVFIIIEEPREPTPAEIEESDRLFSVS
ncbi:hypothetical protein [Phormidium nigroviride]